MRGCRINKEEYGMCMITKGLCEGEDCPTWWEYNPTRYKKRVEGEGGKD